LYQKRAAESTAAQRHEREMAAWVCPNFVGERAEVFSLGLKPKAEQPKGAESALSSA